MLLLAVLLFAVLFALVRWSDRGRERVSVTGV
jgi:hypothetical protein